MRQLFSKPIRLFKPVFPRLAAPCVLAASLAFPGVCAYAATNGIFADFTTSMGAFTCQLDYTNAPRTVANFIGLATGQRAWLDLNTGRARTNAFYNGLTFHRVIAGFMIQGGSPNGLGTDGPGYAFTDEFSSKLTFNRFGVLGMANSGPNSDGSQFFITVAPYTSGNNVYSIFGSVVSGSNVVQAISQVATDSNNKPLTNVVMQQVAIRRVGTAAQAFNINAQSLPVVTNVPLKISVAAGQPMLTFSNRLYAGNTLFASTNLPANWTPQFLGIETTAAFTNKALITNGAPAEFFRFAQVQYASSTFAPKSLYEKTLALAITNGASGTITINFDSSGGGAYTYSGSAGTVTSYSWTQQPYNGLLWPIYYDTNLPPMTLQLNFSSGAAGAFSGDYYNPYAYPLSGTFTISGG